MALGAPWEVRSVIEQPKPPQRHREVALDTPWELSPAMELPNPPQGAQGLCLNRPGPALDGST